MSLVSPTELGVPPQYAIFPAINASLNGLSAILLLIGHRMILRGRMLAHKRLMITALVSSSVFLACYLYYHWHVGSVHFRGHGVVWLVYYVILGSHTILAASVLPLVIITLARALKGNFDRHRAIARWTYPIWLYVSVTGVVVYFMLYQVFVR